MSEKTLEERVQELEDIRAIEKLQLCYWDYMDSKNWDEYRKLFADDFRFINTAIDDNTQSDAEAFVQSIKDLFENPAITSSHHGHQHYIEITGPTTAIARWALEDNLYNAETGSEFLGRGYYDNKYIKIDGEWKCQEMYLTYLRGRAETKKRTNDVGAAIRVFQM